MAAAFPASFDGVCDACLDPIKPGEFIRWSAQVGGWAHEECAEAADDDFPFE